MPPDDHPIWVILWDAAHSRNVSNRSNAANGVQDLKRQLTDDAKPKPDQPQSAKFSRNTDSLKCAITGQTIA
jgi:hypothetical protein